MSKTQDHFDEMELAGVLVKNGKFRPDRSGKMQPAYVLSALGEKLEAEGRFEQYMADFCEREEATITELRRSRAEEEHDQFLADLVRAGLAEKMQKFRPGPDGKMKRLYSTTALSERLSAEEIDQHMAEFYAREEKGK
jgi:hypothetical protein